MVRSLSSDLRDPRDQAADGTESNAVAFHISLLQEPYVSIQSTSMN